MREVYRRSLLVCRIFIFIFFIWYPYSLTVKASPPPGRGTEVLPFNSQLKQLISTTFYRGLQISREKIAAYRRDIARRQREIKKNLKNNYVLEKKDNIRAYKILLAYIDRLKDTPDPAAFNTLALKILEMDYALKVSGKKLASSMLLDEVYAALKPRKIPINAVPEGEARNLVDPAGGHFFSQEQLARMKKKGMDISKLNPPADSTFWSAHDISRIDVKKHYLTGGDALHKGLEIVFPRGKGYFKKIRATRGKPAIDIFFPHEGKELNFKLNVGAEMHAEPTAASLYAALGFSVDISKYARDFKLVLGDISPQQFKRRWYSRYSRFDLDKYIKQRGKDEEGHYIVFYEGLLEARPRELLRVGPWAFGQNGHKGLREVRGTLLFNMWIANLELKEAAGNRLVLRKIDNCQRYRFFHIQHDLGFTFGRNYIERPGDFKWTLVRKKSGDYVHLTYRCFQGNSGFEHITFADARWMVRLIAQLDRGQIRAAVELGGWPESMGKLLVEKLIARRNQLVKAFNLAGEILPNGKTIAGIPFKRYLTTTDGVVAGGKLIIHELPGYNQYFGPRLRELFLIVRRQLGNAFIDSIVNGISAVRYIKIDPKWLGWDEDIISHIILRMNREIELNPKPTGENDEYLVKDTMEIGFRLGYGFVFSGDVSYVKKYTVVYPVRTQAEGRYHNHFIINFMLPLQVGRFGLQQNFAAITEDYIEGRGRIKIGGHERHFNSLLGTTLTASKIYLDRRFISYKPGDRLVYFRDKGISHRLAYELFLEFAYLFYYRVPFIESSSQEGTLTRDYLEMDLSDLETAPLKPGALGRLILENDPSLIKKMAKKKTIHDKFFQEKTLFSLLRAFKIRTVYRVDKITSTFPGKGENGETRYQVESRKLRAWKFLDNGERHFSSVRLTCKSRDGREIDDPVLMLTLRIDDRNTADGELKHGYLRSINALALDKRFIDFNSSAFSRNRRWGYLQVYIDIILYGGAIRALLRLEGETVWKTLAEVSGRTVKTLKQSAGPRYYRGRPVYRYDSAGGTDYLACKTDHFIRQIKKARKAKNTLKKMRYLVKAVRKAVYLSRHSFDPVLLSVIHKILGRENLYLSAAVTMPVNREMVLPGQVPLRSELGVKRPVEAVVFEFIFEDAAEIYHLF